MTKEEIVKKLKNPFLVKEIVFTLLNQFNHEIVQKPRQYFTSNTRGSYYRMPEKIWLQQNPEKDEEDYWGEFFSDENYDEYDYDPHSQYYKRDTLLTGAGVVSVILEKLFNQKTPIHDVDLFYYDFASKDQAGAEMERYNNLQGEDACYHISKVKEHGLLNLIKINVEDNFSWQKVIESFDLNYSQIGIILGENKIVYTDGFIDFLLTKIITLNSLVTNDFPLTHYIRGVKKAKEFEAKFFIDDYIKIYLSETLPELFFTDTDVDSVIISHNREYAEDEGYEFVTKKQFKYWLENPTLIPFLTPSTVENEDENVIGKVNCNVPNQPWVDIGKIIYKNQGNPNISAYQIMGELIKNIPNFFNLKKTHYERLYLLLESNFFPINRKSFEKNTNSAFTYCFAKKNNILNEDWSKVKLEKLKNFSDTHSNFFSIFNFFCFNQGYSIGEILKLQTMLKNWDQLILGTLEAINFNSSEFSYGVQYNYRNRTDINALPSYHKIIMAVINKDFAGIRREAEDLFIQNLAKNFLITPLDISPFSSLVKEITMADELAIEAMKMNHCVSGFTENIRKGKSRIFHITVDGNHSTLEIGLETFDPRTKRFVFKHRQNRYQDTFEESLSSRRVNPKYADKIKPRTKKDSLYVWRQHQGHSNSVPHKLNNLVARRLVYYLNKYRQDYLIELKY